MIAVGNVSMLKPNSGSIPIDQHDDDTPVYLDKKFRFFIDIEGMGELIYTVEPLTFRTETQLISELGYALNTQLRSIDEDESDSKIRDLIKQYRSRVLIKDLMINKLIVKYSRCINPSVMLPSLKGVFSAFTVSDLSDSDYDNLYKELVTINHYTKPKGLLRKVLFKHKTLHKLHNMNMDEILKKSNGIVDSYTLGILSHQDIHTKIKVLLNVIRYEREFKKKLHQLFSNDQSQSMRERTNRDLDNSTLLLETNADMMKTGQRIPVF